MNLQNRWILFSSRGCPDGEVVTYHYNAAGQVERLTSNKQGRQSVIVDRIGYDKEGHTVYTKLGNGTETTYAYDRQRERLQVMNLTADGQAVMENRYRYDAVDNILGITNAANPTSLTKLNRAKLGGKSMHTYEYDELNRLVHASGKAKRASYDMVMSFGRMSEPLTKVQKVDSTATAKSYNFAYKYEDSNHPTAPTQIGHDHYTYDANGNPTLVTNDSTNTTREMYWDEDNRLMVLSDNGKTSRYTYNAAGERIMKSYGTMEGVYINGAPQGITFHETDNFTLYPASIISINKNRFTKHYFIGDKRIASRIGTGLFNNVYGRNGSYVTAGQQDYAERMNQIQRQKEAYYKQQGIAPGVPTMKGAYGDPENTKRGYNSIIDTLGNHDVPQSWIQTPRPNTTPNTNPGPPVSWNDPSNPDNPQAGYGYIPNDTTKEETFFYHSDHLGSTSYITDDHANITQYDAYLPYGELLVDEHSSSEDLPYKFNGKQFDEETGLYYYGARYMNPVASIWYRVDPLAEKYPNISSYCYTINNPIRYIDIKGTEVGDPPGPGYYRARINSRYIGFGLRNPLAAIKIGLGVSKGATDISTNATRFATRGEILYGSTRQQEDRGSENGAFRHTLWQATITSEFGSRVALEAGNAHEKDPFTNLSVRTFSSLDDADQTVDLLNNQIGRRIGSQNKNVNMKDLALQVLEEFKNNGLYTATKKDKVWTVKKTKLSNEKYKQLQSLFNSLNENGRTPMEQRNADAKAKQELETLQQTWGTMR